MNEKHLVLWDSDCGFCRRSIEWLQRRDYRQRFDASPYQSALTPPMSPQLRAACQHAVHVIRRDGRVLKAGRAAMFCLQGTAASQPEAALWRLMRQMPFILFVEIGYFLVARNRGRLSKWFFREDVSQKTGDRS